MAPKTPQNTHHGENSIAGLLTVDEFCSRYSIGRTKAYELIASGELPAKHIGSLTRIRPVDAEWWAENLTKWKPKIPESEAPET